MAGLSYKKYLTNQLDDGPINLGPSPYTQDGFRRTGFPTLGDFYEPIESKMYSADQERYGLDLKEEALGLPEYQGNMFSKVWGKLQDLGKWGINTPVGRGALWIADKIDRPFNALEGALEEMADQRIAKPEVLTPMETLGAFGTGLKKGFLAEKDYNAGRWIEKLAPDSEGWQDFWRARPIRTIKGLLSSNDHFELMGADAMRGRSGPQDDPEYSGLMNMTNADILGLIFNIKSSVLPAKIGRVKVPGAMTEVVDDAATATAKAAKAAEYAPRTFRIARGVPRGTDELLADALKPGGIGGGKRILQTTAGGLHELDLANPLKISRRGTKLFNQPFGPVVPEKFASRILGETGEILYDFKGPQPSLPELLSRRASGTATKLKNPFHVEPITRMMEAGDPSLARYLQLDGPLGEWSKTFGLKDAVPFRGTQDFVKSLVGEGARKGLSYTPGLERFLTHFSNRIESSATRGAAQAFDVIDDGRQGARVAVNNQQARLRMAMDEFLGKGAGLSDNENKVLYYATAMGRDLADPKFLEEVHQAFKIPMDELRGMTRLEPLRQWWLGEAAEYAKRGESAGFFKALDTDYMPIFTKKEYNPALYVDDMASFGQEFSGLRSFQKSRNKEFLPSLLQRGARGELALDNFTDAIDRYSRSFANLERRRNVLHGLEGLGLVSREMKDGFKPLAEVLDVNPNTAGVAGEQFFMNERYMPRFRDEIFGYGGGGGLIELLKGVSKMQNPWKAAVTTLSPKYHTGNLKDDFVRNFVLGDTDAADLAAAVTRGTSNPYVQGVTVSDWVKKMVGNTTQWDYQPGARNVYDLTAREASDLGRAMGVNVVQTTDEIARSGVKSKFGRIFNKAVNAMEAPQGVMREANFLGNLRNQGHSGLAREIVSQDLINYRDISPFLRDVVRPFVPFVTFRAKNPSVALNQLFMNPTWFGRLAQAQQYMQGENENLDLPPYYRDKPVIAWKDQNGKLQVFDTGLSQFDSHFLIPGARQAEQLRRMPGPLVQIPLGLVTGTDALGRPISGPQESNWLDSLLVGQKGADGKTYSPGEIKFILDTLSGEAGDYNVNQPFLPQLSDKFGQIRTFDGQAQALRILLEQNRLRNSRLGNYRDTGTYIPPKRVLEQQRFRLR